MREKGPGSVLRLSVGVKAGLGCRSPRADGANALKQLYPYCYEIGTAGVELEAQSSA